MGKFCKAILSFYLVFNVLIVNSLPAKNEVQRQAESISGLLEQVSMKS